MYQEDKLPLYILQSMMRKRAGKGKFIAPIMNAGRAVGSSFKNTRPVFWKALLSAAGAKATDYEYSGSNPLMGSVGKPVEPGHDNEKRIAMALNAFAGWNMPNALKIKNPLGRNATVIGSLMTTPLLHHGIGISSDIGRTREQYAQGQDVFDEALQGFADAAKGVKRTGKSIDDFSGTVEDLGGTLKDTQKSLESAPETLTSVLQGLKDVGEGASTVSEDVTGATGKFDKILDSVSDVRGEVSKITGSADRLTGQMERGFDALKGLRDAAQSPGATAIYGGIAGLLASKLFSDDPKLYTGKEKRKVANRNKIRRILMVLGGAGIGYAANTPPVIEGLSKLLQRPGGGGGGTEAGVA